MVGVHGRLKALPVLLVLAVGPAAAGCGARPAPELAPPAVESPVWPAPPAGARIRYVRSIGGPEDAGIRRRFLGRLADAVLGRAPERLVRPTGVAERDGVLYVADPGAQALWILDAPRRRAVKVTRLGQTPLASPVAVAPAPDGSAYVADSWLKTVFLVRRDGRLVRRVGGGGLERPAALAYDGEGRRLYVADSAAHRIVVFGADGTRLFAWGRRGGGDGEFNYPTHLGLDRSGTLLVTDALNFRVQAFDRDGRFLWKMGRHGDGSGDLAAPKGVAADSAGHLYVVDALFDAVQVFDREGGLLLAFGERGVRPGEFSLPGGIFAGPGDRIYVADSYNRRVQVFDYVGAVE